MSVDVGVEAIRRVLEERADVRLAYTAHLRGVQHHYLRERAEARRARPA